VTPPPLSTLPNNITLTVTQPFRCVSAALQGHTSPPLVPPLRRKAALFLLTLFLRGIARSQGRRASGVLKYELEAQPSYQTPPTSYRYPDDPSPTKGFSHNRNRRRSSIGKLAPLGSSPPGSEASGSPPKAQTVSLVFTNQRERRSSSSMAEPIGMYTHPLVKQQQLQLAFNVKVAQAAQVRRYYERSVGDGLLETQGPRCEQRNSTAREATPSSLDSRGVGSHARC
jgi:hypothetical protein